ncbi:unnamed protein product, partial [Ectocarpus sp. 12 AP-2014]
VDSEARKVRYLQIEGFDYNSSPLMQMTWRLQMDMYICAPWGNYELELVSKSTNGG